jgi:hypothetical protein
MSSKLCILRNDTESVKRPNRGYGDEYENKKVPLEIKIVTDNNYQDINSQIHYLRQDISNYGNRICRLEGMIDKICLKQCEDEKK